MLKTQTAALSVWAIQGSTGPSTRTSEECRDFQGTEELGIFSQKDGGGDKSIELQPFLSKAMNCQGLRTRPPRGLTRQETRRAFKIPRKRKEQEGHFLLIVRILGRLQVLTGPNRASKQTTTRSYPGATALSGKTFTCTFHTLYVYHHHQAPGRKPLSAWAPAPICFSSGLRQPEPDPIPKTAIGPLFTQQICL